MSRPVTEWVYAALLSISEIPNDVIVHYYIIWVLHRYYGQTRLMTRLTRGYSARLPVRVFTCKSSEDPERESRDQTGQGACKKNCGTRLWLQVKDRNILSVSHTLPPLSQSKRSALLSRLSQNVLKLGYD